MRGSRWWALILVVLILVGAGCSAGGGKAPDRLPVAPGSPSQDLPPSSASIRGELLSTLAKLTPAEAVARRDWGIPGMAIGCVGAPGDGQDAVPVLACQWGPGYNAMFDGREIFWYAGDTWHHEPYPPEAIQGVGYFQRLQQDGADLVVTTNAARGMTRILEQVQILRRTDAGWQVVWVQPADDAPAPGGADVFFYGSGVQEFVRYTFPGPGSGEALVDAREVWQRRDDRYERTARAVLPEGQAVVHRFVNTLVRGLAGHAQEWEEAAAYQAASPEVVAEAKRLGLVEAAGQGFQVQPDDQTIAGAPAARLVAASSPDPWRITLSKNEHDDWVVAAIEPVH